MKKINSNTCKYFKRLFLLFISMVSIVFVTSQNWSCKNKTESEIKVSSLANEQQPVEDDWWLPETVTKTINCGFIENTFQQHLSWKQLNPSEGVYDFSVLDQLLSKNIDFWIMPYFADSMYFPKWVVQKYHLASYQFPMDGYDDGTGHPKTYVPGFGDDRSIAKMYPIWDPGVVQELSKLLKAMANHNAIKSNHFKYMYVPGAWRWSEWSTEFVDQMKSSGKAKEDYLKNVFNLLDAFADAFSSNTTKLVFTGYNTLEYTGDEEWSNFLSQKITKYAISKSMGARHGFTENFNSSLSDLPDWGLALKLIDGRYYSVPYDTVPLVQNDNNWFYTENECYGGCDGEKADEVAKYYNWKMSNLKALQLRMKQVLPDGQLLYKYPAFKQYVEKTLGKKVNNSPDVWACLRSWNDWIVDPSLGLNGSTIVHNWERWLYQREVSPDGLTEDAYKALDYMWWWRESKPVVFEAKKTIHAKSSDYIYFNIDDHFVNGYKGSYMVKITYLDNFNGSWYVQYQSANDIYKNSQAIINVGDNGWKTISLTINDAVFANGQKQGNDFRIYNGGTFDISVRFVRIIKTF